MPCGIDRVKTSILYYRIIAQNKKNKKKTIINQGHGEYNAMEQMTTLYAL